MTHRASPLVGVNGAEGVVLCGDGLLRQQVEEGGLSHVGETDNAHLHMGSERWVVDMNR